MVKFIELFAAKVVAFFDNIKTIYYMILGAGSIMGAYILNLLGGWDIALRFLLILIGIDIVTGVVCALFFKKSRKTKNGAYESKESIKGLLIKGAILLVVIIAVQLDEYLGTNFFRSSAILFFSANEGFSIIENLGIMGVPFPDKIKEAFELLRTKSDKS